jgi:nucleotide-binding universal stress UspA family protein
MKKILVPTDFSDCAEKALRYAAYLAKKMNAEIILLHVCDLLDPTFTNLKKIIKEYNDTKIAELTSSLKQLAKVVEGKDLSITTKLYNGEIVQSILTAAQKDKAAFIVMGTLGATGLKTLFFGTKAAAVINESSIPVITVPYNYEKTALKEIIIAANNTKQPGQIFKPVFDLSQLFDAKIKTIIFTKKNANAASMVSNSKVAGFMEKKLERQFPGNDVESVHIYGTDFHESMQKYIEKEKTDLVVMLTHQRTFMQNLFRFSMTRQMAYHITIPLMSLKGAAPE